MARLAKDETTRRRDDETTRRRQRDNAVAAAADALLLPLQQVPQGREGAQQPTSAAEATILQSPMQTTRVQNLQTVFTSPSSW